jgi:thiol-disulfide isomerase/thioredoxin/outer membrane lipoprotein-sorting protein
MRAGAVVSALLFALAVSPALVAQSEFTDPVELLRAVAKTYAGGVESFHIESVTETVHNSELEQDRQINYDTAIKDPANRYRIESQTPLGNWTLDSDGTSEWLYLAGVKKYMKHQLPDNWPKFPSLPGSWELANAWAMRPFLEGEVSSYKHATMMLPETIEIAGKHFDCYVVHVTSDDQVQKSDPERSYDLTFWIDKHALVIRKKVEHQDGYTMLTQKIHIPQHHDTTTTYPVVDLHPQTAPQMFVFTPPAGATEVAAFESDFPAQPPQFQTGMVGKPAPDITFTTANGRKVALSSYRGKPVLLDLWATWCGPCLLSMPALGHLYAEFKDKGLTVITVDQDHAPESATAYLARHNYNWTNYHDPDNKVGHALQDKMVPLTVLIDAQGKIVYYDQGGKQADVRKAIASLGTDFAVAQTVK